ncbi:Phospholipase A(2) [Zostera marina]|uniref:phospholipase A2 n=1 Tax=Zostera marina TaxID=29655 RepID=A0A0K9Q0H3_ZOSMR|nr:Phospholipase A(2) [Zostera marina]
MKQACTVIFFLYSLLTASALNVGLGHSRHGKSITVTIECSRKCESKNCGLPPILRYGKYCGLLYSGCPGEKPCDGLDACCMVHDACVRSTGDDYLSVSCNRNFLQCISVFKNSNRPSFLGNTCSVREVIDVVSDIIQTAIIAGRKMHHN